MSDPLTCARCGIPIEHWYEVRWRKWSFDGMTPEEPEHVGYCPGEGCFCEEQESVSSGEAQELGEET